jgi:hypothetical protein
MSMSQHAPTPAKTRNKMPTILIGLLVVIASASVVFLILVARLSVEEADLWLRPITGILLLFTFVVGGAMLITGYIVVDKLGTRVANAQTEASNAKLRADQEAIKRLELEESLQPRMLETNGFVTARLKKFEGASYLIQCPPDFETRRLAGQLRFTLGMAGWKNIGTAWTDEGEGVRVESLEKTDDGQKAASAASMELVSYLEANRVDSHVAPGLMSARYMDDKTPIDPINIKIKIRIGPKPDKYLMDKMVDAGAGEGEKGDWFRAKQKEFREQEKAKYENLAKEWRLTAPRP